MDTHASVSYIVIPFGVLYTRHADHFSELWNEMYFAIRLRISQEYICRKRVFKVWLQGKPAVILFASLLTGGSFAKSTAHNTVHTMLPIVIRKACQTPQSTHDVTEHGKPSTAVEMAIAQPPNGSELSGGHLSPIWVVEFEPEQTTRQQVYEMLSALCEKLVVAFNEISNITTSLTQSIEVHVQAVCAC
jgi:hypothetical protein